MNIVVALACIGSLSACGGGSGGGGSSDSTTIQGTLRSDNSTARGLGEGEGGIAGVQVSALGDAAETDEFGNFVLSVDGNAFQGGEVLFSFVGAGMDQSVILDGVSGGPGVTAYTNFQLEKSGSISGESTDAEGNVLGQTAGGGLDCSVVQTFHDGGLGALWKPVSEKFGTVVILMPPEYRQAGVQVFNVFGEVVDGPLFRDCCQHNGGREHIFLSRRASDLAGAGVPLTVRFEFPDGFVDCRTVPDPNQRYD